MRDDINIEQELRNYLPTIIHMSLGTSRDNKPWVCEVHYAYDDDLNLYFRSLPSRRHSQEIADNPNVAGNIVRQHALGEYPRGVYFEGKAELLNPGPERDRAFEAIKERYGLGQEIIDDANKPDGHKFYKITVETFYMFAKFSDKGGQKYELKWNGAQK